MRQYLGAERMSVWENNGNEVVLKGNGQRDPLNTYYQRIGVERSVPSSLIKPIDINLYPDATSPQVLVGGGNYDRLSLEFDRLQALDEMNRRLGSPARYIPEPKGIYELEEFPVILPNGSLRRVAGRDYFMNPTYMSWEQRQVVAKYVKENAKEGTMRDLAERVEAELARSTENQALLEDSSIAEAFVSIYRPAVLETSGPALPRIGHIMQVVLNDLGMLRDLLIEKGTIDEACVTAADGGRNILPPRSRYFLSKLRHSIDAEAGLSAVTVQDIKDVIDEQMERFYASVGISIQLPLETLHDLHSGPGRRAYLKEIRSCNPTAVDKITTIFMQETARQLGIIHGSGGHVGGCSQRAFVGSLCLTFTDKNDRGYFLCAQFNSREESKMWWSGDSPRATDCFDFTGLNLKSIASGVNGESFSEMGPDGAGSTRSDNMGAFGLRDFDTHCYCGIDPGIDRLMRLHPTQLKASPSLAASLRHHYLILKQQVDLDGLFYSKDRMDPAGYQGSFMHFTYITGGGIEEYYQLKKDFVHEYNIWYERSQTAFAFASSDGGNEVGYTFENKTFDVQEEDAARKFFRDE